MSRNFLKNFFLLSLPTSIIIFILCELFFRLVIPAAESPFIYYDFNNNIMRYDSRISKTGVYTIGKFAQTRARWRINNMGWNSNIDYRTEGRSKPLIAVIGDSFVEALQINLERNMTARLRERIGNKFDVYSFGMSGFPLSGYLQISRYVNKYFKPEMLIFVVIHNDLIESLCSVKCVHGMLCLKKCGVGLKESEIALYTPSKIKRILAKSSLFRYIYSNLNLKNCLFLWQLHHRKEKRYNANIDIDLASLKREEIILAVNYLLNKIKEENPNKKIIFLMDGPRKDIYLNKLEESNVIWINNILRQKCQECGFYFIDMTDTFAKEFASKGIKFDFEYDYHWNDYAHELAASMLYHKLKDVVQFDIKGN